MEYANGVRPYVLEWFYEVLLPTYSSHKQVTCKSKMLGIMEQLVCESRIAVTTTELINATREIKGRVYSSKQLLETYIYPLMNQGFIDYINSEIDHRANIYFPAITSRYINLFKNNEKNNLSQACRINIRGSEIFTDRKYLIHRIEEILKYYSEEGIRAILCDHEGKEISIEELVVRYYSRPEDYFEAPSKPLIQEGFQDEYSKAIQS